MFEQLKQHGETLLTIRIENLENKTKDRCFFFAKRLANIYFDTNQLFMPRILNKFKSTTN